MISLLVERGAGDKRGEDITDELITSDIVAQERGRNEIEYNYSDREEVTTTGPFSGFLRPGKLAEVADSEGVIFRGMIKSCAIEFSFSGGEFAADTSLEIERVKNAE